MKKLLTILLTLTIYSNGYGQWSTVDMENSGEVVLFEHTGTSTPVPFSLRKIGYEGSSINYGLLHLDMAHSTIGGGSNLHFRLKNSSNSYKEYGGIGAYIIDNTSNSEDGGLTFYTTSNGAHRTRQMTILNNGNVGIGSLGPESPLHIKSSTNRTIRLDFTGVGSGASYTWQSWQTNSAEQWRVVGRDSDNSNLEFWNKASNKVLTLLQNGNIGIGTNNPLNGTGNYGLQISKGIHSSLMMGDPNSGYGGIIQTSDGRHRIFIGANIYDDNNGSWSSFQSGKGTAGISLVADEGSWGTSIDFLTSQSDGHYNRSMKILGNGNVGIGTTSIPEKLTVSGNVYITGDLKMSGSDSYIWTNGTGTGYTGIWDQKNRRVLLYTSENTGNVGIGHEQSICQTPR